MREIAELLTGWQLESRLFLVPFGELQREIVLAVPAALRVVLYRRMMLRIADRIARERRAGALVTGEVIGQVASQTLENLSVIAAATSLPILRPLVGMDKEEIIAQAERIGTYGISIVPDQDCCQLFTPQASGHASRAWATSRRPNGCCPSTRWCREPSRPRKSSGIGSRRRPPPLRRQAQERLQYARFTIVRCISQLPKVLP